MSNPARTGTLGRTGRLRAAHATASASASRSTRNFTFLRPPQASGRSYDRSGLSILPRGMDMREVAVVLVVRQRAGAFGLSPGRGRTEVSRASDQIWVS